MRSAGRPPAHQTVRAWVVDGVGAPGRVLERREVPVPAPGPGFLRLRMTSAAVGLPDVLMCQGSYPLTPALPFTPGQEGVGVVTAVGPDVDPGLIGTRQMGVTAFYVGAGALAEEALASASTVFPAPPSLDDVTAAGFHIPFHTAWNGLVDRAGLAQGETVAVLGAAGGSGGAAVLLAKALGATVIAIAGGADKAAFCATLGADHVVDHRQDDVAAALRHLTGNRGVDVVFDPVGGEAGERAAGAMAGEGRFLLVGFAAGRWPLIDPAAMVGGNFAVLGVYAGAYGRAHVIDVYSSLLDLVDAGTLATIPTRVVDFDAVPECLDHIAARVTTGKTVVRVRRG